MYDMYPALVPVFSASAQAFSSAALRACSLSATMRWLASDTCAPAPKFCRYAVYAATVQAFSAASLRVCASAACGCCWAPGCCESEGWLQADTRAAPAMAATSASLRSAIRPARLGCRRKSSVMADLAFSGFTHAVFALSTPPRVSSSINMSRNSGVVKDSRAPRLPAPTRRRQRRFRGALPDRSIVELNGHAVRGIDRAEIGPGNPEAAGVIHPASGRLADLVDQVELPTVLGDEGEAWPKIGRA